jgi:large subunit ribosomal protein L18
MLKPRKRRHKRIRAKIKGTESCPRVCVFRSNQHIYAQLIDDEKNNILAQASDVSFKKGLTNIEKAKKVGEIIAKFAEEKKISEIVFDRAGYKYHGRVRALAESIREKGLKF